MVNLSQAVFNFSSAMKFHFSTFVSSFDFDHKKKPRDLGHQLIKAKLNNTILIVQAYQIT